MWNLSKEEIKEIWTKLFIGTFLICIIFSGIKIATRKDEPVQKTETEVQETPVIIETQNPQKEEKPTGAAEENKPAEQNVVVNEPPAAPAKYLPTQPQVVESVPSEDDVQNNVENNEENHAVNEENPVVEGEEKVNPSNENKENK